MATQEDNAKTNNNQENSENKEESNKKLISLDNADFSNKSQTLNSPRSLEACLHLGVMPSELYQLSMEDFKLKYPEVRTLNQELLKFRYDEDEKYRKDTIEEVKKERKKIIENEKKKKEAQNKKKQNEEKSKNEQSDKSTKDNKNDKNADDMDTKLEKLIEAEKKNIEKIKKKQKQ